MTRSLRPSLLALAGVLLCAAPCLAAEIMVYRRGPDIRFDPEFGETLREVRIETWSVDTRALVEEERVEAYYHLYEDAEVITPQAVDAAALEAFEIERQGGKYFFRGPRPEGGAAPPPRRDPVDPRAEPADASRPLTEAELLEEILPKVEDAVRQIIRVRPDAEGSATMRRRILNRPLAAALDSLSLDSTRVVCEAVADMTDLRAVQRFYALRSLGWARYDPEVPVADKPPARLRQAIVFYRASLALRAYASSYYQLGHCYRDLGDVDGAVWAYGQSVVRATEPGLEGKLDKYLRRLERAAARAEEGEAIAAGQRTALQDLLTRLRRTLSEEDAAAASELAGAELAPWLEAVFGDGEF